MEEPLRKGGSEECTLTYCWGGGTGLRGDEEGTINEGNRDPSDIVSHFTCVSRTNNGQRG